MQEKYCQSCGMPMGETVELYGTNSDGSRNEDYCKYCYENGEFTQDITMNEMIEFCVPHMASANEDMTEDEARKMMKDFFPTLKRWKKSN
ncbi:MAG: zinc ribbon domain-containing protein [Thermotogota bacterium]